MMNLQDEMSNFDIHIKLNVQKLLYLHRKHVKCK